MIWNEATRGESRAVVDEIPPLSWRQFADLFREEDHYTEPTAVEEMGYVSDPPDREFAALAKASGAVLITNDRDLLSHRDHADVCIVNPEEFLRRGRRGGSETPA